MSIKQRADERRRYIIVELDYALKEESSSRTCTSSQHIPRSKISPFSRDKGGSAQISMLAMRFKQDLHRRF